MEKEIKLGEAEHIETLFKVYPPLDELEKEDGYGYIGVVLRNTQTDTLQCHICGNWFKNLTNHFIQAHKIKSVEYRKKFGLPLNFPLVSKALSESFRKTAIKNLERCPEFNSSHLKMGKRDHYAINKKHYSWHNPSWDNKHACCEQQLCSRYDAVADILGKEPASHELADNDPGLVEHIKRKHGSLNNFRSKYGYKVVKNNPELSDGFIIGSLRKFLRVNKRLPRTIDFMKGTPNTTTIFRRFGSWNRALASAGII